MTPAELYKQKYEAFQKRSKGKRYLYEVHNDTKLISHFLADSDTEAVEMARDFWGSEASYIRIDEWGKGPKLFLK